VIISASRRTDIPAFYSEWFMNRIRAGYCLVPNPFNRTQISRVSLEPADVDVIVFWTRNPRHLLPLLSELDDRGYRYYFLYTLMANPRQIDPGSPPAEAAIENFRSLSDRIGPARVIWRYDPIFLSTITDPGFHERAYSQIAQALKGYTNRSVVSVTHMYRKIQKRISELAKQGIELLPWDEKVLSPLMRALAESASMSGMEIRSCADELDLQQYGIQPGKCVDDELISRVFGLNLEVRKDSCQRKNCGCAVSKDIGMYDSCLFGCTYCYAATSFERARTNYQMHDPEAPSILG
jgi:DNA repair photolyase